MRFTRDIRTGPTRWALMPVIFGALAATGCFGEGSTDSGGSAIMGGEGAADARPDGERPPTPCDEPHEPPPCAEEVEHCFGHARSPEEAEGCAEFERECFGEPHEPPPCAEEVEQCFGHARSPEEFEGCAELERECFGEPHEPPPCETEVEFCFQDARSPERSAECEVFAQECLEGR